MYSTHFHLLEGIVGPGRITVRQIRFVNQVQLKWLDAENECSKTGDGHLVSIGTQVENQWLHDWWVSMLAPLSGRQFEYIWTGFTDRDEEGTWVWSDGTNVTFINWGGEQPDNGGGNSDCGTMVTKQARTDGKWDDAKCFAKKAYMCEYAII
ncbi:alpha-N-acetylgalactosamine-specific lectin-like isoform X2 [Apostichopus japonicus]|uniref:alpha-N-acetylgalactosamine-specific lectin-like isoform X2 n=1 Tax=Stichopus japonicus TaxID=307972 RepID=UPI003AB7EDE3